MLRIAFTNEIINNSASGTLSPISANLRSIRDKSFPPLRREVAGMADFEMVTILLSRPGWLIYLSKLNIFSKNHPYLIQNNFGFLKHKPVLKPEHSESQFFKIFIPGHIFLNLY